MTSLSITAQVLIIGGGVSGLATAANLDSLGITSIVMEKSSVLGGKVKDYSKIFPDFSSGKLLVKNLIERVSASSGITTLLNATLSSVVKRDGRFEVTVSGGGQCLVRAIILASGFDVFDAQRQEEYGYGVYPNVLNSLELEARLDALEKEGGTLKRPSDGKTVERVAIIFCVGSRSKRLGNPYCSRICCSYSTKQAIEIVENNPDASVTCFYMDIRTYDRGFEEMYQYAQELGVKYIRGRASELSALPDGTIHLRAENTLLGRPVQGMFDLVSLSVGMTPCADAGELAELLGIDRSADGFFAQKDCYLLPHDTQREGIFLTGSVTGLKPIKDCLMEAQSVSGRIAAYLNGNK